MIRRPAPTGVLRLLGALSLLSCASARPSGASGAATDSGPSGRWSDAGALPTGPTDGASADLERRPLAVDDLPLVPRPRHATTCAGAFAIDANTAIVVDDVADARGVGAHAARWLGLAPSRVHARARGAAEPTSGIVLLLDKDEKSESRATRDVAVDSPRSTDDEAYVLDVDTRRVVVRARHPAGLFYGAQSLAQLAGARPLLGREGDVSPEHRVPCVHIEDAPRFAFRAMHLDVARHFFSREVVERYVDLLSFYRFNVFHWHLTDDQGFRIAIRSHPELTDVGARRKEDGRESGGFYTQDEARSVVAIARDRFVTVIPEVEMPGHTRAILAAHPELSCTGKRLDVPSTWGIFDDVLCAGNDATYTLLDDVLGEFTDVFPSRLIHVGGDEVPKHRWESCPKCRARMKTEKLSPEALQGWFMRRVAKSLEKRGRRAMAWDEALDGGGLPESGVVVAWQGQARGAIAARAGHDVVMAPHESVYFNKRQSRMRAGPGHDDFLPWTSVLGFDPLPSGLEPAQTKRILGGEGTLWTEYVKTPDEVDTLLMPRLAALSEALWSTTPRAASPADASPVPSVGSDPARPAAERSFASRLRAQRALLDRGGVGYFVEPPAGLRKKTVFTDSAEVSLAPPFLYGDGVVRYTVDGTEPNAASPAYVSPFTLGATTTVSARVFLPGGRTSPVVQGLFERAVPLPSVTEGPSSAVGERAPGVKYTYIEGDFAHVPDFQKLAARTVRRVGRLPGVGFAPSFRSEHFAVLFEGLLDVPKSGVVRFGARSDDGIVLDVDGVRVFEDDGNHPAREVDGDIALAAGSHTVRIGYFQGGGGKELALRCQMPGAPDGPCLLVFPDEMGARKTK